MKCEYQKNCKFKQTPDEVDCDCNRNDCKYYSPPFTCSACKPIDMTCQISVECKRERRRIKKYLSR